MVKIEENIVKRGKNLVIVSTGIILYIVAGGMFKNASFMDGGITFEHPEYLEYAILVIFFYSLFRYYLSNIEGVPDIKRDIRANLRGRKDFRTFAHAEAQKYIESRINKEKDIGGNYFHKEESEFHPKCIFDIKYTKQPIKIKKLRPQISIRAERYNNGNKIDDYEIVVPRMQFFKIYFLTWIKYLFQKELFWDKVFPYLIVF